jgi:hypothetical protein
MSVEPGDRDADKVLRALCGKPDGMTRHEIRRSVFSGNKPAESIAAMLATLERLKLIRSETIETGGRPAERWYAINAESPPAAVEPEPAPARPVAKATLRPRSEWGDIVANWPIAWRRRWADRAETLQAAGLPWDIAEYRAYLAAVEEMNGV